MAKVAAVVVRGFIGVGTDVRKTLASLNLRLKHSCVILEDSPLIRGSLRKCKDVIAFGTVSDETAKILEPRKRGKIYRLHPPRGGWKSTKLAYRQGGALGDRGDAMNELLKRMV